MDYEGQRLSEQIMQWLIIVAAVIGFLAGYITSSYRLMLEIYTGGMVLAFLLAVPDWPYFNWHKLSWLPEQPPSEDEAAASSSTLAVQKSKQGKRSSKGKR
ncbi:microsomal signal peptidase complex subunit [Klebsormidium nitens]|uniref:Signal peptidase complex subunit 1 n=1 Tax=Klebsormidium nitens TaxID=105231 RepID=A0A1Y1IER9_KLENI|nr:microsomal signal peptidase complex subunit [Klebsormidium nitens]|eukprot:GAQ88492.1 microsomal signal peptidase complex subunit [Klebsormidium nitens]